VNGLCGDLLSIMKSLFDWEFGRERDDIRGIVGVSDSGVLSDGSFHRMIGGFVIAQHGLCCRFRMSR
jgi:hypothetical protein